MHLQVEFVGTIVKLAQIGLRCSGSAVVTRDPLMGGFHSVLGEQCIVPVVLHEQGGRRAGSCNIGPVSKAG